MTTEQQQQYDYEYESAMEELSAWIIHLENRNHNFMKNNLTFFQKNDKINEK